jgi:hypothetical protein
VTDVSIPFGAQVFWNPRRALIAILLVLAAMIAVLSWSAVKAERKSKIATACSGISLFRGYTRNFMSKSAAVVRRLLAFAYVSQQAVY